MLVAVLAMVYSFNSQQSFAYVDLEQTMKQFDMYKEYEVELTSIFNKGQKQLDSVKQALIQNDEISPEQKEYQYGELAASLQNNVAQRRASMNEQVLQKLNLYMKDFAKSRQLDLVFGAEGSGVIMAANPKLDQTKDAISFINEKYQKGE